MQRFPLAHKATQYGVNQSGGLLPAEICGRGYGGRHGGVRRNAGVLQLVDSGEEQSQNIRIQRGCRLRQQPVGEYGEQSIPAGDTESDFLGQSAVTRIRKRSNGPYRRLQ